MTVPGWRALLLSGGLERIAFGAGALADPDRVARMFRARADGDAPTIGYLLRILGVRDVLVGATTVAAARDPFAARWASAANLACQIGDCAVLVQELRKRGRLDVQTGAGLGFAVFGVAVWGGSLVQSVQSARAAPLRRRRRRRRQPLSLL